MDLSVVIPLYNESESIDELNTSINNILNNSGLDYELISVSYTHLTLPTILLV
mgnify:CR=1 FL=1